MDMLVGIPEPEDLAREESHISFSTLREEIRKLRDKYGQPAHAVLTDVESIVSKYENSLTQEAKSTQGVNAALANLDQDTVVKAQHIVKSFLRRKKFAVLASQFLTSPLAKELGKRNEIWREILQTERSYFQSLVMLYETFYKPLKMKSVGSGAQDHKILTEKQIFKIFQNIEDVKNSAKNMWKKLEEACKNWPESAPRIGQVVLSVMQELRTFYIPYVRGLAKSMTNLAKTRKTLPSFSEFLDRTGSDLAGSEPPLPLHSLLMLPSHRLSQYEAYLRELVILTPPEHIDYTDLVRGSREMSALVAEIAPAKIDAFKAQKLYHINASLKGPSVPNILAGKVEGTRIYIREGPLLSIGDRRNKRSYLFLFTDCFVLADINEATEERLFDFMMPLTGAEIKEIHDLPAGAIFGNSSTSGGGIAQHLFAVIKENKKVILGCCTLSERASWMNDISTVINELSMASSKRGNKTFSPKLQLGRVSAVGSVVSPRDLATDSLPSPRRSIIGAGSSIVHSDGFLKSLSRQHPNKSLDNFIEMVPSRIRLSRLVPRECLAKFRGPTDEETETEKFTHFAAAKVTSTYPFDKERNIRMGDPIADHCGLAAWGNRILAVIADGCFRGYRAQQAASRAVDTFISDFVDPKTVPQDLREIATDMIRSVAHAHENIIDGSEMVWDAGTTTLLAGLLLEVEASSNTSNQRWCFLCLNVGDSKAFIWNKQSKQAREVTNHLAPNDLTDPGGRIGPYIYQGSPDLRDLSFSHAFCNEDDIIIMCSDGVYDNFDPELSGLSPADAVNLVGPNRVDVRPESLKPRWDQLDIQIAAELRAACRIYTLEQILSSETSPAPKSVTRAVVNYCVRQTRSSREFVEQNTSQVLPPDYTSYPGHMDHLTCLTFQVGTVQL